VTERRRQLTSSGRLAAWILAGMAAGCLLGCLAHAAASSPQRAGLYASYFSTVTDVFLRLIKMIIAPLVLATLVTGIVRAGSSRSLGRVGVRAIALFVGASLLSISFGLAAVGLLRPGVGFDRASAAPAAAHSSAAAAFDFRSFVSHLVPQSIIEAMAGNEVLQIVVFALFAGIAIVAVGERAAPLARGAEALVAVMLKITDYVMRLAPLAACAALAASITTSGPAVLVTFGKLLGGFYLALGALWLLLLGLAWLVLGARPARILLRYMRDPLLLAFATASSEAAFPATLEQLERAGVPEHVASFVLPLGYSFNLIGSMMYCSFALVFIAQAFGIELTFAQQLGMLLLLMVTSKGLAGVPRAALVVLAAALPHFNLPEQGLLLLLGVDQFLDMGRTATNVLGNAIAAALIARWEGATVIPNPQTEPQGALS
jgi:Na+/H+-dicarboxylate symporter